jgi:predicted NBD/HSP70 family sugar kinase
MMRFYTQQHRFYAGIDLHARTISVCVLDATGAVVKEATINASPAAVLDAVAAYRDGLVVGCEDGSGILSPSAVRGIDIRGHI